MLDKLYRKFEEAFDIPFASSHGINGGNVWYQIGPKSSAKEYFSIKISFVNDVRIVMELLPDDYSKPFLQDIGNSSAEKKEIFLQSAKCLQPEKQNSLFK